ncbi:hypothetical protein F4806DRAFT_443879 [Annulohypoxylon nitens]|nr:hypothetical protein F4806DRAFT_443879 [Annulohypoxylon nitens]
MLRYRSTEVSVRLLITPGIIAVFQLVDECGRRTSGRFSSIHIVILTRAGLIIRVAVVVRRRSGCCCCRGRSR